jgi:hypothetical protein
VSSVHPISSTFEFRISPPAGQGTQHV